MPVFRSFAVCLAALLPAVSTHAQEPETPQPASPPPTSWEGAIGVTASYRPEYSGAAKQVTKLSPALFLRYGRFTITNASGFVTRRADDVVRGVAMEVVRGDRLRVTASLRVDQGRSEGTSDALKGMGDIRPTIRLRTAASYRLDGPWRLGASVSPDILGKGGGWFGDVGLGWEKKIEAHTTFTIGAGLSFAGDRYLQSYYGVSEEQAARTGYAVYTPRSGLRDASLYANVRHDLNDDWIVIGNVNTTRLLGPAATSPLTGSRSGWGISAGIARRF